MIYSLSKVLIVYHFFVLGDYMTIKDAKRNFVIESACKLFLERSISAVTIKDIALASGIGEATVYRYFSKRSELVVACAVKLEEKVEKEFSSILGAYSGYEKLSRFYGVYLDIFTRKPTLYRFLNEFDAYCINEGNIDLERYADGLDRFKVLFLDAYNEGVTDGTVSTSDNIELFYYTTTHSLLSLCKKLAIEDGITRQDKLYDNASEVKTLIEIILSALKP